MTNKTTLTLKKPLSLEKESQIYKTLISSRQAELQQNKLSKKDQEKAAQKKKREGIKAALKWIQENYPLCFNPQDPKPLKLKIEEEIFAALPSDGSITRMKIRQAIDFYTRSIAYLKSLLNSTHRYDLQGQPVQDIYPAHKAWAQEKLEKTLQQIKAKKDARYKKPTEEKRDNDL